MVFVEPKRFSRKFKFCSRVTVSVRATNVYIYMKCLPTQQIGHYCLKYIGAVNAKFVADWTHLILLQIVRRSVSHGELLQKVT